MDGKIYKITNVINEKVYIGQTIQTLTKRWWGHWSEHCRACPKLKNSIRKYGKENFTIEIIDTANLIQDLNKKEEFWIKHFNSVEFGYNLQAGGGNRLHLPESIRKMEENNTKRREIVRISLKDGTIKEYNKISDVILDGFDRSNVSLCLNGKKEKYLGYVWKFKSKKYNIQHILETISDKTHISMYKPVIGTSDNGVIIEFNKLSDAKNNGFSRNQISLCARGIKSKYKGYTWRFKS